MLLCQTISRRVGGRQSLGVQLQELKKILRMYRPGGLGIASASTSDRRSNSPKSERSSGAKHASCRVPQSNVLLSIPWLNADT
eukprot:6095095-Amphidinium_carterae.1